MFKSILIISDLHAPYMHIDTPQFLYAIKKKYNPDKIISIGDEIDGASWSYHETDQSLPNPDEEINLAIHKLQPIYNIFPFMDIMDSNHGSLAVRKSKTSNIPKKYLRPNKEVIEAPQGWNWHNHLDLQMSNGQWVRFIHAIGSNVFNAAKDLGMSLVQGHYHTKLSSHIEFVQSLNKMIFGLQVGCLIDDKSMAFHYNKLIAKRPAIGSAVIINGIPIPLAMILDKDGRWIGRE